MDPASLIPAPGTLQVPWGWFELLLVVTFVLHLVFMNVVVGSSFIMLINELRQKGEPRCHDLATKVPTGLALAVNAGVAPLLFLQVLFGHFFYPSAVIQGWWFLSIIGLVILAYYGLYLYDFRYGRLGGLRLPIIALVTALLLCTGFLLVNLVTLMLTPDRWAAWFSEPGGTFLNLGEPTLLPRYLHFMAASAAVGGLFMAILWKRREAKGVPGAAGHIRHGMEWFTWGTVVQSGVGLWFLLALPREIMLGFMGDWGWATGLFLSGLVLAGALLYFGFRRMVWPAAGTLLATILIMALMRDAARTMYLAPWPGGSAATMPTAYQYSPLVLFLIALLAGLGVIAWMLRVAARANDAGEEG